jgi:epoxyqueuosine reductase
VVQGSGSVGDRVRAKARALGFDAVGFARADAPLDEDHARYRAFVEGGLHGTMQYLADDAEVRRRLDGEEILRGARSVVCVARSYRRDPVSEAADPLVAQGIARYARGHDYHNVVRRQLRRLAVFLRTLGSEAEPVHARPMCDDVPVLERAWAARAGLGFVGKNGMLIVPGDGSLVLLGEVVTTLDLPPDAPMTPRCGACTRCLEACPTHALDRPFVLDARRCVAYLNIELSSAIPEGLRSAVGERLFGCDDCQTVCPFNQGKRSRATARTRPFEPLPVWHRLTHADLLGLDEATWQSRLAGSPVKRAELAGTARNAAIVLGNRGDQAARPALARAAEDHPSEVVREAARWALSRLER